MEFETVAADFAKLGPLRQKVFGHIAKCLAEDGHCKRYEGTFVVELPNYFDATEDEDKFGLPQLYTLRLSLYVFGPNRHYEWKACTLGEAIDKAERDVDEWWAEWESEQ